MELSKLQLIELVTRETKPPEGMGQWLIIFEAVRMTKEIGILRLEWYSGTKLEWSSSLSVTIESNGRTDNLGTGVKWSKLKPGTRQHNVMTFELRSKSLWENIQGFFKRSMDGGKIQDFLPWVKK